MHCICHAPPSHNVQECHKHAVSYIPLISPTSTDERIRELCTAATSFIYVVSALGVTGARTTVNLALPALMARLRSFTKLPLAVGFGVSTRAQFGEVGTYADGVVIGSQLIRVVGAAAKEGRSCAEAAELFAKDVAGGFKRGGSESMAGGSKPTTIGALAAKSSGTPATPPLDHRFGTFGGQYAPETLMFALNQLENAFLTARADPAFWTEFRSYYPFIGRPSKLQLARRLTAECGGARVWLKREDLNHTGSHKINNALGQVLLARRLGKTRIIAETGAGQHG